MLPVRAAEISFGSIALQWGGWCGATLSLLTAHLSHFVSDCIHLHGPISSCVARGWRASMSTQGTSKYTNICFLPNRKVECYTQLKYSIPLLPPFPIYSGLMFHICFCISFTSCFSVHDRTLHSFVLSQKYAFKIICVKDIRRMQVVECFRLPFKNETCLRFEWPETVTWSKNDKITDFSRLQKGFMQTFLFVNCNMLTCTAPNCHRCDSAQQHGQKHS